MSAITRAPWLPPKTSSGRPSGSSAAIGLRRRRDHRRPHRIAGARRLGGERAASSVMPGKLVAIAVTRGASIRLARPITAFCVVDHGRNAPQGRRQQRRQRSDSRRSRPPRPAGCVRAARSAFMAPTPSVPTVRAIEIGSRPRTVALGITCVSRAGKSLAVARRALVGRKIDRDAAPLQRVRQRLGGKQMSAGAARRQQNERLAPSGGLPRGRQRSARRHHRGARALARQRQQHAHAVGERDHRRAAIGDERQASCPWPASDAGSPPC